MMKFKVKGETVVAGRNQNLIPGGDYKAEIQDVVLNTQVKSKYGNGSRLTINYKLQDKTGTAQFEKTDFIWCSEAENSRCVRFLSALYDGELPEEMDIQEWVGRCGWVKITHETKNDEKENGEQKTYDNITAWDFSGQSDPDDEDKFFDGDDAIDFDDEDDFEEGE